MFIQVWFESKILYCIEINLYTPFYMITEMKELVSMFMATSFPSN